jgi:hypothetical protein
MYAVVSKARSKPGPAGSRQVALDVRIIAPSGENANDLGGVYAAEIS